MTRSDFVSMFQRDEKTHLRAAHELRIDDYFGLNDDSDELSDIPVDPTMVPDASVLFDSWDDDSCCLSSHLSAMHFT